MLAAAVLTLGLGVIIGWLVKVPALIEMVPGLGAMAFITALGFMLTGVALIAPEATRIDSVFLRTAIGALLLVVSVGTLIEHVADVDLGVDLASMQAWYPTQSPRPGRMAPNTALAFAAIGATLIVMHRLRGAIGEMVLRLLSLAVLAIGTVGIVGYVLGADFVYSWTGYVRMALHTAIGMTLSALALMLAFHTLPWYRYRIIAHPGESISMVGASWLISIALIAGLTGFAVMKQRAEESLSDSLAVALQNRIKLFESVISLRAGNATLISTRPAMLGHLRTLASAPDDARAIAAIADVAESFLPGGFNGVAIYDTGGREIANRGTFAVRPTLSIPLDAPHDAQLLWDDGFVLRTRTPLADARGPLGLAIAEQRLPVLTKSIDDVEGLGESGDAGICGVRDQVFDCFPQRLRREAFTTPMFSAGRPLPMRLAFDGNSGVVRTIDYRGRTVIAAYGPIGTLGLGTTLKVDAAEIYAPVRERLKLFGPMLLALILAGAVVLRLQLKPLVTQIVESREAVRRANAELKTALQAKDRFLATMSHELRTPLNAIIGFTGTLLMRMPGPLNATQEKQLQTVQSSARHLLSLISDLLDLAKLDAGSVQVKREPVQIRDVVEQVVNVLGPAASDKALEVSVDCPAQLAPLMTDKRALTQIVMNLIDNAIKYTRAGSVRIECRQQRDRDAIVTEVSVRDTGTGIAPDDLGRLFGAFTRVGDLRGRRDSTGLGLYFSRKLAELLGGTIRVASELGVGSTFTLVIEAPATTARASD